MIVTNYPHHDTPWGPLYFLTNQGCEDTGYWSPEQFKQLGLFCGYDDQDRAPYPLTDDELSYLGGEHLVTPAGGDLLLGYSALFQKKKWVALSLEYYHGKKAPTHEMTGQIMEILLLKHLLDLDHQHVIVLDNLGDRVNVLYLVNFTWLQTTFNSILDWRRFLERGLGASREKEV